MKPRLPIMLRKSGGSCRWPVQPAPSRLAAGPAPPVQSYDSDGRRSRSKVGAVRIGPGCKAGAHTPGGKTTAGLLRALVPPARNGPRPAVLAAAAAPGVDRSGSISSMSTSAEGGEDRTEDQLVPKLEAEVAAGAGGLPPEERFLLDAMAAADGAAELQRIVYSVAGGASRLRDRELLLLLRRLSSTEARSTSLSRPSPPSDTGVAVQLSAPHESGAFFADLSALAAERVGLGHYNDVHSITALINYLGNMRVDGRAPAGTSTVGQVLGDAFVKASIGTGNDIPPPVLTSIVVSLARMGVRYEPLSEEVKTRLEASTTSFTIDQLSNLSWANYGDNGQVP